jgi:hypothetical protein
MRVEWPPSCSAAGSPAGNTIPVAAFIEVGLVATVAAAGIETVLLQDREVAPGANSRCPDLRWCSK